MPIEGSILGVCQRWTLLESEEISNIYRVIMNIKTIKKIHFTGIKGVGMTALALLANDLKMKITGSDTNESFTTEQTLKKAGIKFKEDFSGERIKKVKPDLLIYTGAHFNKGEVRTAKDLEIPTMSQGKALGFFMKSKKAISVCGVGGKTTTSAMIATVLTKANLNPSFAIGVADIPCLGTPAGYNKKGEWFIAEADEYIQSPENKTPKFFSQNPEIAVLTNLAFDHPDAYLSFTNTKKAFKKFLKKIPSTGLFVTCLDNQNNQKILKDLNVPTETYGFSPQANWQIIRFHQAEGKVFFSISFKDIDFGEFILNVPGRFNALNATAALVVAHFLGIDVKKIKEGLELFTGTKRRFEKIAEIRNTLLYDDYAHHPLEIRATLKAAKEFFIGKKITAVFQPHTYSRTKALFSEFVKAFENADQVIITDIYASARETGNLGISGEKLAGNIEKHHPGVKFLAGKKEVIEYLAEKNLQGTVIFTMGAGDVYLWGKDIVKILKNS